MVYAAEAVATCGTVITLGIVAEVGEASVVFVTVYVTHVDGVEVIQSEMRRDCRVGRE